MLTIVIPTYWGRKTGEPGTPQDAIFDHPTPLDGEDTLTRCLESLSEIGPEPFGVVLITATVHPDLNSAVEKRVEEILIPFRRKFPLMQFAHSDLLKVRKSLARQGIEEEFFSLRNYSTIRNCQLLVPALLGAGTVSALDDDEVVAPDFARRAEEYAGKEHQGHRVDGVAGVYYYKWGSYHVAEPEGARQASNLFARKAVIQNQSYDRFDASPGRLVNTTITLGGNMVFSKELYENVPFDPQVPRGEDIDYMINSLMLGYRWMLDKELRIEHYPPPCKSTRKLQEDFVRFYYEKRKLELSHNRPGIRPVTPEELVPYPGEFLKDSMVEEGMAALKARNPEPGDPLYRSAEEVMAEAEEKARKAEEFFTYAHRWPKVIQALQEDEELVRHMREKMAGA